MNAEKVGSRTWVALLPVGVLVVNLLALGLLYLYSHLNLRPFLPVHQTVRIFGQPMVLFVALLFLLPALATGIFLRPVFLWVKRGDSKAAVPPTVVKRAANAPVALGIFTAGVWSLIAVVALLAVRLTLSGLTPGL
jgi:hypothetical protein